MTIERPLRKMDIVKLLRKKHALGPFLEISTPTTGRSFSEIRQSVPDAHRLVYNCPADANDGEVYTYRTSATTSDELIQTILAGNGDRPCYDIIFVDPFHTYASSSIDMSGAFLLLRPGGIMVVHDCNPAEASLTSPGFVEGDWCGLTYMAFIDFTLRRAGLEFYTVDTDSGCGVIYKERRLPRAASPPLQYGGSRDRLAFAWDAVRHGEPMRFDFFDRHRRELLNLKSTNEFFAFEGLLPAMA